LAALTELHPTKQGLKPPAYAAIVVIAVNLQSYIQQNKDWNCMYIPLPDYALSAYRATSNKTRIETQGTKQLLIQLIATYRATSNKTRIETWWQGHTPPEDTGLTELHPTKQGLKLQDQIGFQAPSTLQSYIQQNKDWNSAYTSLWFHSWFLQSYIQQNKDWNLIEAMFENCEELTELHPTKQGLKHSESFELVKLVKDLQSYIQQNKDWNPRLSCELRDAYSHLQSYIQQNKDWNKKIWRGCSVLVTLQSYIQQNKDWNYSILSEPYAS